MCYRPARISSINPDLVLPGSQGFKVPHLRAIYQKTGLNRTKGTPATGTNSIGGFGFQHDGKFEDLFAFLSQPVFDNFANNGTIKSNLQAFVLCLDTGTAPAVGYTRTALRGERQHRGHFQRLVLAGSAGRRADEH